MKKNIIRTAMAVFALAVLVFFAASCGEPPPPPPEEPASSSEAPPAPEPEPIPAPAPEPEPQPVETPLHTVVYPIGGIGTSNFIDHERETYDGTMVLRVPRMNFEGTVLDGTANDVLDRGAGLFPEGQLPGPENRNVCIAGHRDIHGGPFMDIDKFQAGDLMYVTYHGKLYTYEYVETLITDPDDWTAIKVKDYSALTLQSCTPAWVASHRIFAIGKLISVEDAPDAASDAALSSVVQ